MLRLLPILTLVLLLGIQVGSPLCLAVSHALAQEATPAGGDAPSSQDESHQEQCWFSSAHLFNKGLLPSPALVLPFFCVLAILPAIIIAYDLPRSRRPFRALPDRAPPSRAFLQIYRI